MTEFKIRAAVVGDEYDIMQLVQELATYEKEPDAVINTPEQLNVDLFEDPICECLIAEIEGEIKGIALFYTSYSTWKGRCLYLEDLFIQPDYRQLGIGKALFEKLVNIAQERNVKRMDWQVLNWNEPAISFYKRIGATLDPEWLNGRLFFE
jgi:GNAT superfamily N-acetyltransferase